MYKHTVVHKKITFKGATYWFHQTWFGANISPLDHYDEEGNLTICDEDAVSYAILQDKKILRHGEVIGTVDDLKDVE